MRTICRLALTALMLLLTTVAPRVANAAPINVAEFRWDTIADPGIECPPGDLLCEPADPFVLSIFSLTNIWDGPGPGPTLFDNGLSLPTGDLSFFDLGPDFPFHFDQLALEGLPAFAAIRTSFIFAGEIVSLGATLTQPNTFAVLQFDPATARVPEPGTLCLVALGAVMLVRRANRSVRHRSLN